MPGSAVQWNTTAPDLQQHLHVDIEERQQPEQVFFRSAVTVGEERRTKNSLCSQNKYKLILYIKEKYYKTTFKRQQGVRMFPNKCPSWL